MEDIHVNGFYLGYGIKVTELITRSLVNTAHRDHSTTQDRRHHNFKQVQGEPNDKNSVCLIAYIEKQMIHLCSVYTAFTFVVCVHFENILNPTISSPASKICSKASISSFKMASTQMLTKERLFDLRGRVALVTGAFIYYSTIRVETLY
mgnify:CR=1 FL=1